VFINDPKRKMFINITIFINGKCVYYEKLNIFLMNYKENFRLICEEKILSFKG
jgi:hypothetical protein